MVCLITCVSSDGLSYNLHCLHRVCLITCAAYITSSGQQFIKQDAFLNTHFCSTIVSPCLTLAAINKWWPYVEPPGGGRAVAAAHSIKIAQSYGGVISQTNTKTRKRQFNGEITIRNLRHMQEGVPLLNTKRRGIVKLLKIFNFDTTTALAFSDQNSASSDQNSAVGDQKNIVYSPICALISTYWDIIQYKIQNIMS